jgi:hypothetical protein
MEGLVRIVSVPDKEWSDACKLDAEIQSGIPSAALGQVFYYGQNEVQNVTDRCSVSVGDIACIDGKFFRVASVGFSRMGLPEIVRYVQTPRRDRLFWDVDDRARTL